MAISNDRRFYLTLPDEEYKERLRHEADSKNRSMSKHIVKELDLLDLIRRDPVGMALVTKLTNNGQS